MKLEHRLAGFDPRRRNVIRQMGRTVDVREWFKPVRHDTEADAAREVLEELADERLRLKGLAEALERKNAAWTVSWITYDGCRMPSFEQLFSAQRIARCSKDVGGLHLASGEVDHASDEVDSILRLQSHLLESRQTVISILLAGVVQVQAEELVHEGVGRGLWDAGSLARWEASLSDHSFQEGALCALRGELAYFFGVLEFWKSFEDYDGLLEGWGWKREEISERLKSLWRQYRPDGFAYFEMLRGVNHMLDYGIWDSGRERTHFTHEDARFFRKMAEACQDDMNAEGWSVLQMLADRTLQLEAKRSLLRTGIALERFRLKHGEHPGALEALVPEFLPEVLVDPYDGKPLRYRLQADGSPWVWSVGENGVDDGGLPHQEVGKGDLIWITKPIPGFTLGEFRKL